MKTASELVRACYDAYESKDKAALEILLAEDFTFSSPIDDNISRDLYMKRCWPNSQHIRSFHIEHLLESAGTVFVNYQATPLNGKKFRNTEVFRIKHGKIKHVDVYFGSETAASASAAEIKFLIESWAEAIRRKDTTAVLKHFDPDSVRFYLAPPLVAIEPLKENLDEWFATFKGELEYEIKDLKIHADSEVAFTHALHHLRGTKTDGSTPDMWFRETLGLRKKEGQWLIVHSHESVPFAMNGSNKAEVNLES